MMQLSFSHHRISTVVQAVKGARVFAAIAVILFIFSSGSVVFANSAVSQGYKTKENDLTPGTLMGLSTDDNTATPATSGHDYQLIGLVADSPLIALNDGNHQAQIVINGTSNAIVTDINGAIKAGDKITSSPISGVGMKATDAGQIVGTAQADLSKSKLTEQTVTDKTGKQQKVKIGSIPLQVSVTYFAGEQNQGALASFLPPFVLHAATGIAGQQVSPIRVLIALLALIAGFVVTGTILQAAIRANIIAIGRNPLAKKTLRRELIDVCLTGLAILLLTSIAVYIIVKI